MNDLKPIRQNITAEEIERDIAYMNHKAAIRMCIYTGLPYRICLDDIKGEHKDDVSITPYYPLPELPPLYQWDISEGSEEQRAIWRNWFLSSKGETIRYGRQTIKIKPRAITEPQEIKAKPCKLWDLRTEQGREHWLYWFMAFIMPYADDIPTFTMFDMFGDTGFTSEDLKAKQEYYADLINRCRKTPVLYRHGIPQKGSVLDVLRTEYTLLTDTGIYTELAKQIQELIQAIEAYTKGR